MPHNDEQIRKNTILALNMAAAAVKAIEESEDRIVLQQEYDAILKNLNIGCIDNDGDLQKLYTHLLKTISDSCLDEEQCRCVQATFSIQQRRSIIEGMSAAFRSTGKFDEGDVAAVVLSPWLAFGKALTRGVSAYFGYREAKKQKKIEFDEKLWKLDQDKIRALSDLRINLFTTTWNLLHRGGGQSIRTLTSDDLRMLEKDLQNPSPEDTLKMLRWDEDKFRDYPPYWFYRVEAAMRLDNEAEARKSLDCFDHAAGDVLRRDPYKVQAAKYRLLLEPDAPPEFVKEQLAIIRRNAVEWTDLLFYGVLSYAVGEKEQGKEAVEIVVKRYEEHEISPAVLRAMEIDQFDPSALLPGLDKSKLKRWSKGDQTSSDKSENKKLDFVLKDAVPEKKQPVQVGHEPAVAASDAQLKEAESALLEGQYHAARNVLKGLAEAGNPRAMYLLAECCERGLGGDKDEGQTASWLEKAKDLGEPLSRLRLAEMLPKQFSLQKNKIFEDTSAALEKMLRDDDAFVQYALGRMYQNGWGCLRNIRKAVQLYKAAADLGHPDALLSLGQCYLDSDGLPGDPVKAAALFMKAAEKGNPRAMYNLGVCYENGTGVKASHIQAVEWCAKAQSLGCTGLMTKSILAGTARQ